MDDGQRHSADDGSGDRVKTAENAHDDGGDRNRGVEHAFGIYVRGVKGIESARDPGDHGPDREHHDLDHVDGHAERGGDLRPTADGGDAEVELGTSQAADADDAADAQDEHEKIA